MCGAWIFVRKNAPFAYAKPAYRDRFKGEWQRAVEQAVLDMIDDLAQNTPAGRLRTS